MDGRAFVVIALILAAGFAGCISTSDPAEPEASRPHDTATLRFQAPVALPHNAHHGAEPNIAILEDGTIFVAAMSGNAWKPGAAEGNAWLWRSQDGGTTWDRLRGPYPGEAGNEPEPGTNPPGVCSCDADVVTSPDGWVYYTDWWTGPQSAFGNFLVERSADAGDTWSSTPVTIPTIGSPSGPYFVDRQWLFAGEEGFVALFYHQADTAVFGTTGEGATLKMVSSHDHGESWGLPVTVMEGTGAFWDLVTPPRVLPDGTIVAPVLGILEPPEGELGEAPARLRVLRSTDQGTTWHLEDILDLPRGPGAFWAQSIAADDAGGLLLAFNERLKNGTHLFTIESEDGGETWSEREPLATSGFDALPWVTAMGDGRFAVAWYSSNWTGDEADAPAGTEWFAMAAEREAPGGEWRRGKVDQTPVWTGPMCFDGAGCGDRPLRDYLSLEYAPDGVLHVAYTQGYVAEVYQGQFQPAYGMVHTARVMAGSG